MQLRWFLPPEKVQNVADNKIRELSGGVPGENCAHAVVNNTVCTARE